MLVLCRRNRDFRSTKRSMEGKRKVKLVLKCHEGMEIPGFRTIQIPPSMSSSAR